MEGLPPYPAYKDSGLPWLGRVPAHWGGKRGKALFNKVTRPVHAEDGVITCFRDGVVTLRKNRRLRGFTEAIFELGYQGIRKGDLVIHAMDAFAGAIGVSDSDGKGTPVYAVCQPQSEANSYYYAHIVREMARTQWIQALSRGIRERSTDFRYETFGRQELPVPPSEEQAAIVRFLDHATRRIDNAIRAKRKIIALLNEQKQAIIHRAVTRGLDPGVPLRDSGVPWLGEIPAHWEIRRAKYLFREVDERSPMGDEELLSVSHITGITPRSQKNITMFKAETYAGHKLCYPGDLVINTMWAWMAALGVSQYKGIISPAYAVYRQHPSKRLLDEYCDFLLRTKPYVANYICRSTGVRASRLRLYPEQFFRIAIIIPPIDEQKSIVAWLLEETKGANIAIGQTENEITLLREYRTRLIADVVTGKLDVREAATRLPEQEDETAPELAGAEEDEETLEEAA
ncbi:MAG TPA: restriction endonuclease subunit S [Candidatus Desulfobacillus denitrificans]|nr:restriction endonuclease subunit S [Candidatus Desulfobacillus denitrificans]